MHLQLQGLTCDVLDGFSHRQKRAATVLNRILGPVPWFYLAFPSHFRLCFPFHTPMGVWKWRRSTRNPISAILSQDHSCSSV